MSNNKREGDYTRLVGVICLAVFLVFSTFVQAVPPEAEDAVVTVESPSGTEIILSESVVGLTTSYIITSLPTSGWLIDTYDDYMITEEDIPYTLQEVDGIVSYGQSCPYLIAGGDSFTFMASNTSGDSNVGTITLDIDLTKTTYENEPNAYNDYYPLDTFFEKVRSQAIYHADELGSKAQTITSLALEIKTVPPIPVEGWTIRMKETTQAQYSSAVFDNTGTWTPVYTIASELIPEDFTGWYEFVFQNPFEYDGTSNLMIDFIIDSANADDSGYVYLSATPEYRFVYKSASSGDPVAFTTADGRNQRLFNIKLQGDPAGTEELFYDLNFDCGVDLNDFSKLAEDWGGLYGISDLVGLCEEWLK